MFQYTHEVIFNSLTMPDGSKRLVRNGGSTGPLTVKRGGEYWKAFIQDQKVYKTAGNVGVYELLKIDVEKLGEIFPGQEGAFMTPGVYQLNMFVKLLDPHALYEFGYPNYMSFGRHILVGFDVEPSDEAADHEQSKSQGTSSSSFVMEPGILSQKSFSFWIQLYALSIRFCLV